MKIQRSPDLDLLFIYNIIEITRYICGKEGK